MVPPKVIQSVYDQHQMTGTSQSLLLPDNVSPNKAKVIKPHLKEHSIQVFDYLPYSPDLAPCDFWLFFFSELKEPLAGWKFTMVQDLSKVIISELTTVPASQCQNAPQIRLRWLELCVASGEMYFKGVWEFSGGTFTGFRSSSLAAELAGWLLYFIVCVCAF